MHCQHELLTIWLDTMVPTMNSFNFSTVINMTQPNLVWKGNGLKMNSRQLIGSIELLTNGSPVFSGFN